MNSIDFKQEMFEFKNKLYRLGLRLLSSEQEAEDAVQETYLKLWKMRKSLDQYKSKEALAMTITKNYCLDQLKAKRRYNIPLSSDEGSSSGSIDPHIIAEQKDDMRSIHHMISKLPEQQKIIVQLRDIEQYEFEEIAEITGMNLNAIRVNLSRARKQLRQYLIQQHNYENA
jgi:RNA polymerase sigma-70 factor (ECF subfamily)